MTQKLFNKEGLTRFDLQKEVVIIYAKSFYGSFKLQAPLLETGHRTCHRVH
jgi:hypothetical protein